MNKTIFTIDVLQYIHMFYSDFLMQYHESKPCLSLQEAGVEDNVTNLTQADAWGG